MPVRRMRAVDVRSGRGGFRLFGAAVFLLAGSASALESPKPSLTVTGGTRHVEEAPAKSEEPPPPPSPPTGDKPTPVPTHKKGKAPKTPGTNLPETVPLSEPNDLSRAAIAGGTPREKTVGGAPDPEVQALREADRILFPTKVIGLTPGWSWDLPDERKGEGPFSLQRAEPIEDEPPVLSSEDVAWLRSLTLPDLPIRLDQRVVTYLKFYRDSARGRTIASIWAKTSGKYVGRIQAELRRAGLPADLVWLSMIESGHNPTIASPAGAVGLWQFMPDAGRTYGLVVDRWVDERRDPSRATNAAVRFLSDLYQRFGSWELAMAAYNMGHAGLGKSIAKFNTNDYWLLSRLEGGIPWETTLYVPKIFALAIVMNNREAFGLKRIVPEPVQPFDTVLVEPGTPLLEIAKAAGIPLADLQGRNLALTAERLPPGGERFPVRVPEGKGTLVNAALAKKGATKPALHVVRIGEDFETLALDSGVTSREWLRVNGLTKAGKLEPKTVLLMPPGAAFSKRKEIPVVVSRRLAVSPNASLVFYEVRAGDTLDGVAAAFQVSVPHLCRDNALDPRARLREGMTLQVQVPKSADLALVRHLKESEAMPLLAASVEFHEFFEGLRGNRRVEVVVRPGDTLSTVGQRFGMSVGSMERVNRRSRSTKLVPGETLVVYTTQDSAKEALPITGAELPPIQAPHPELLGDARE